MRYSVVVPMYNSEHTIKKAINSVIRQTRFDLIDEVVVVDDGSTDQSASIILELQRTYPIIRLIKKQNGGAANARNIGISQAKNDYIALLDADDEWLPNKIEVQNSILEYRSEIKAIGSNRIGEHIRIGKIMDDEIRRIKPFQYCLKCWPCTPSLIFDKSVFGEDSNYFPEDMTHAEEGLFFLRLSHDCGLFYSEKELVLCGGGKRAFGVSGLSGDLKKMHGGVIKMLKLAKSKGYVNRAQEVICLLFENIKYFRRIVIQILGWD